MFSLIAHEGDAGLGQERRGRSRSDPARLPSSPEESHQSLRRRRERLESPPARVRGSSWAAQPSPVIAFTAPELDADDVEDLDDAPEQEVEDAEARILDQATDARSIVELKAELDTLKALESLALGVRRRSADTKWRELASLLGEIFTATGRDDRTGEPAIRAVAGAIPRPAALRIRSWWSSPSTGTRYATCRSASRP